MTAALASTHRATAMTPRALNVGVAAATRQAARGASSLAVQRQLVDGGFSEGVAKQTVEHIEQQLRANRAAFNQDRRKAVAMALLRVAIGVVMMVAGFASGRFGSVLVSAVVLASGFKQLTDANNLTPGGSADR